MIAFPKPYSDAVAKLRVPCGFAIVLAFAIFSRPDATSMMWGMPVSLAGLALRAWAAGCLRKDSRLATFGPYAYLRNPLYVGTLLVAAGLAIASRSIALGALFAAVFFLIYLPAIQLEEQHLRDLFPEFDTYAANVRALLPRLTPWKKNRSQLFSWEQYGKNREYQAALGFAAGAALLVWKVYW